MPTRRELRQLALRSTRNPREWLPVLQDALLETYDQAFEDAIERAQRFASNRTGSAFYVVTYDPLHGLAGRLPDLGPFAVHSFHIWPDKNDFDPTYFQGWSRVLARQNRVIAYIAPPITSESAPRSVVHG